MVLPSLLIVHGRLAHLHSMPCHILIMEWKNPLFVLPYPNHGPQFAASTWSTSNQACRQWPTTCLLFSSSTQIRLDPDYIVGDANNDDGNDEEEKGLQYAENLIDENPT